MANESAGGPPSHSGRARFRVSCGNTLRSGHTSEKASDRRWWTCLSVESLEGGASSMRSSGKTFRASPRKHGEWRARGLQNAEEHFGHQKRCQVAQRTGIPRSHPLSHSPHEMPQVVPLTLRLPDISRQKYYTNSLSMCKQMPDLVLGLSC